MGECRGGGVSTRKYNLQNFYPAHKSGACLFNHWKGTGTGPRAPEGRWCVGLVCRGVDGGPAAWAFFFGPADPVSARKFTGEIFFLKKKGDLLAGDNWRNVDWIGEHNMVRRIHSDISLVNTVQQRTCLIKKSWYMLISPCLCMYAVGTVGCTAAHCPEYNQV